MKWCIHNGVAGHLKQKASTGREREKHNKESTTNYTAAIEVQF